MFHYYNYSIITADVIKLVNFKYKNMIHAFEPANG